MLLREVLQVIFQFFLNFDKYLILIFSKNVFKPTLEILEDGSIESFHNSFHNSYHGKCMREMHHVN